MPTLDLFRAPAAEVIKASLRDMKLEASKRTSKEFERAIDYMEGRQVEHVRRELRLRYRQSQQAKKGEQIEPVTLPLTERFTEEAADAYSQPLKRELVSEGGEVQTKATEQLQAFLEECAYDEHLHQLERVLVNLKSSSLWYQVRRGMLRPRVVVPHKVHPVVPADSTFVDPSDSDDYLGFIVELVTDVEDANSAKEQAFVFLSAAEHIYFECDDWTQWGGTGRAFPNPFRWPQIVDTPDGTVSKPQDLPLQMLTVWHARLPLDELFIDTDPEVAQLNHELNVQLSVLLDTMRTQGMAQMFMNTLDGEVPARVPVGSRFAIPLKVTETIGFANAGNDYTGMVEVLKGLVKLIAVMKSQSPNDFATDGTGPESGFAKLVASLPKIEARMRRIMRMKAVEEQRGWPRIAAAMKRLGRIDGDPTKLKLRVKFPDMKPLETPSEKQTRQKHAFDYDMSSPVHELAAERGITVAEAEKVVEEHAKYNEAKREEEAERMKAQAEASGQAKGGGSPFGNLARRKSSTPPKPGGK